MSPLLEALDPIILRNRAAVAEGDVFSILAQSPFVIRSFEFANADGAINCTRSYDPNDSFAKRLWTLEQENRFPVDTSELVLFDVKSSFCLDRLNYYTTLEQRSNVAFYIGICGTDPSFIDIIPNYHQSQNDMYEEQEENRTVSVNGGRLPRVPLSTFGINQTNAPYRLPISLFTEAIRLIRRCALGQGIYINPWTLVQFPDWKPRTTSSDRLTKPSENTAHFTAYKAAMEIYRAVTFQSIDTSMVLDFVGLQPRLADFKIILKYDMELSPSTLPPKDDVRQVFIQHKLDSRLRSRGDQLKSVRVARNDGEQRSYYFSALYRFDFLFFQFLFSDRPNPRPRQEILFLPEYVIPDMFYKSTEKDQDFSLPEFARYRVEMDEAGEWTRFIRRIIETELCPQKLRPRPFRESDPSSSFDPAAAGPSNDEPGLSLGSTDLSGTHTGRGDSENLMKAFHKRFFFEIMRQCAQRRSGLLVVYATNHPVCDFGYCRYTWKEQERDTFLRTGRTPIAAHNLPACTPIIPICCYTRYGISSFEGPEMTSAQFRRLDSCDRPRLLVWDLLGQDSRPQTILPVVIPSDDLAPTKLQREVFNSNLTRADRDWSSTTPTLSALLNRGLFASQYNVEGLGPTSYDSVGWQSIWVLLDKFTGYQSLQHPVGHERLPSRYQITHSNIHQRLAEEYHHHFVEEMEESD